MADKPTHVLVDRESLDTLVAAAGAAVEDLVSGLADGTFEEDMLSGYTSEQVEAAIKSAEGVLA